MATIPLPHGSASSDTPVSVTLQHLHEIQDICRRLQTLGEATGLLTHQGEAADALRASLDALATLEVWLQLQLSRLQALPQPTADGNSGPSAA
jgi:hypothetical protein